MVCCNFRSSTAKKLSKLQLYKAICDEIGLNSREFWSNYLVAIQATLIKIIIYIQSARDVRPQTSQTNVLIEILTIWNHYSRFIIIKCITYLTLERRENFNDFHHKIATIYSLKLLVTVRHNIVRNVLSFDKTPEVTRDAKNLQKF